MRSIFSSGSRSTSRIHFLFRYASAGVAGALTLLSVVVLLVDVAGVAPSVATNIGYGMGVVINYLLQRSWVFRSTRRHREAFPRFLVAVLAGASANYLAMIGGMRLLKLDYIFAQVVAMACVPFATFSLNLFWTFADGNFDNPSQGRTRDSGSV